MKKIKLTPIEIRAILKKPTFYERVYRLLHWRWIRKMKKEVCSNLDKAIRNPFKEV